MTIAHPSPPEPGVAPTYPWAEWLDGRPWTLVRGRDFWPRAEVFRRSIQGAANGRRIKVEIQIDPLGQFIDVKAVSRAGVV